MKKETRITLMLVIISYVFWACFFVVPYFIINNVLAGFFAIGGLVLFTAALFSKGNQ